VRGAGRRVLEVWVVADDVPAPPPLSAFRRWRARDVLALLPKIVVTGLLAVAIADMLAGVFLRYVMVEITDLLDLDPVNFFWVEEVGELSLTWLTMIGAAIGIADRIHFTLRVLTHHLPLRTQRAIHVANHLLIAAFGALAAWYGTKLAIINSALTSPSLQINLAWVYASVSAGGALIFVYAVALALTLPGDRDADDLPAAIAAGGE
jgi:TRAP-type C4-dicarboxylate transport system permease small subunit